MNKILDLIRNFFLNYFDFEQNMEVFAKSSLRGL